MNVQQIESYERCERLSSWSRQYIKLRIDPLSALYSALDAGLTGDGEKSAIDALIASAANPGLDVAGTGIYAVAVNLAHLAGILAAYLRGSDPPWERVPAKDGWEPNVYESGGSIRRVVLIDHWSEQRKMQEIRSWRTIAEIVMTGRPMLINFLSLGSVVDRRRVSAWTRGSEHPRNGKIRFRKRDGEEFSDGWRKVWREDSRLTVDQWLGIMQADGVFEDLIHSVRVPVPSRQHEWKEEVTRMGLQISSLGPNPPMRRSGCYRYSPCPFLEVCHGSTQKTPGECGWISVSDIARPTKSLRNVAVCV